MLLKMIVCAKCIEDDEKMGDKGEIRYNPLKVASRFRMNFRILMANNNNE